MYSSTDIIRHVKANEVGGAFSTHGRGEKKCTTFWWDSPKERDHLDRPSHTWEDGMRMDLRETGLGGVDWI
jgi:hypothetical protein